MGEAVNRAKDLDIDWGAMSSEWRGLYRAVLDDIIAGRRPWLRVDRIYRETLDTLLERHVRLLGDRLAVRPVVAAADEVHDGELSRAPGLNLDHAPRRGMHWAGAVGKRCSKYSEAYEN